jgi:hypothetical protein
MKVLTFSSAFSESERQLDDNRGRLVICRPDELRPHPSYARHHVAVPADQLSTLANLGDLAFVEPLVITADHIILDGFARWTIARHRKRPTLACIEYNMSEDCALQHIVQRHRRSSGLNDFVRICLALELESSLKEKAQANRQAGSLNKGSSNLAKAGSLDIRREIARIAGVSVGNVSKVKQMVINLHPDLISSLQQKELSIHRAWLLSKFSQRKQREELMRYQSERGIGRTIRRLVSAHVRMSSPSVSESSDLTALVSAVQSGKLASIKVVSISVPGRIIFVTEDLLRSIQSPAHEL